jgi:uncharacterized protein (DUF4415 family)
MFAQVHRVICALQADIMARQAPSGDGMGRGSDWLPKEQVAIRFDQEVLSAFRARGPGWQTRMNAALKEWLATHPPKRKAGRWKTGG